MKKPTILIIDDEISVFNSIKLTLRRMSYDLVYAENGLIGLEKAHELKPSVIICDLKMPVMDGIEFLKQLSPKPKDSFSVLMLTAHGHEKDMNTCYKLGATLFLNKPFGTYQLMTFVKTLIELQDVKSENAQLRSGNVKSENKNIKSENKNIKSVNSNNASMLKHRKARKKIMKGNGEIILIVDDEKSVLESIKRLLIHLNYTPTTIDDPLKALALVKKTPHDFATVIMDYKMPTLSGNELGKRIKQVNDDLPIIQLTGNVDEPVESHLFIERLSKPIHIDDLGSVLNRVIVERKGTKSV